MVDLSSSEAVASACVLQFLLMPLTSSDAKHMPAVLYSEDSISPDATTFLVMCTNGLLQCPTVLQALLEGAKLHAAALPVIAEEGFRFPTPQLFDMVSQDASQRLAFNNKKVELLLATIKTVFTEIGVRFQASEYSIQMLEVGAAAVLRRLVGGGIHQLFGSELDSPKSPGRSPKNTPKNRFKDPNGGDDSPKSPRSPKNKPKDRFELAPEKESEVFVTKNFEI